MSAHAETALDQLALADHLVQTAEQEMAFLTASNVHALLALADAVRDAAGLLVPTPIHVA